MDIIKELVGKIPHDGIGGRTKLTPADGARGEVVIEQPRGEAYYYVRGNGTKNWTASACARRRRRTWRV